MDNGSICPICFAEYVINDKHYPVALKCGHLFGFECIEKWMQQSKRNYCPTCSEPCKKVQIRKIYASRIVVYDKHKEHEYMEKYMRENEEKKILENKIQNLESQIDIMKMSIKQNYVQIQNITKLHTEFFKYSKIHFYPENSIIEFDSINQVILISCYKNGCYGFYKYFLGDTSINCFIDVSHKIRDMKVSPFNDGLLLLAYGNFIELINIYSETVIAKMDFENDITSVGFDLNSRDHVFYGDSGGFVGVYNLIDKTTSSVEVSNININVVQCGANLYASTIFETFTIEYTNNKLGRVKKVEIDAPGICTNISSTENIVFLSFRDSDYAVTNVFLGKKFLIFSPEVKQINKHYDRIFNGYVFIMDDNKKAIKVLDYNTLKMVHSYPFKEQIVGFSGDSNNLIVLTKKGLYCYK